MNPYRITLLSVFCPSSRESKLLLLPVDLEYLNLFITIKKDFIQLKRLFKNFSLYMYGKSFTATKLSV